MPHLQPLTQAVATALLSVALGSVVPTTVFAQTPEVSSTSKNYNLSAGPLSQVLYNFAGNAGITLSFEPSLTEGLHSNGLRGSYSVQQGLNALLATHNLEAVTSTTGGYRLRRVVQDASTLPTINVASAAATEPATAYAGGQIARGGSLGLLGSQSVMDTPFSTNNYTAQLLEDQQVRTLADVVVNDASVRMTTGSTGFDDTFQIRGFAVGAGDVGFNGLYGLISSNRVPAQIIERVEVLKGPGAVVNGIAPGGSVGGGINVVSKRASDTPLTRLTGIYTGKSNFGLGLDMGRRFGENNEWGIRFNGLARDGEATIDDGNQKTVFGALGIDYRNERMRWSLDVISQHDDTDNFRPQISLQSGLTAIPAPPDARKNFYPGTTLLQKDSTVATRIEYDISDVLSTYAGIGYRDGTNEQVFPGTSSRGITPAAQPVDVNGNFRVLNSFYDSYSKTLSSNAGLRWRLNTAAVKHTINVGMTHLQQEAGNAYITSTSTAASNIYNPSALPVVTAARTAPNKASDTALSSIALSDTLSLMDERLLITVGLRHQSARVQNYNTTTGAPLNYYNKNAISPLAGIVFKPVENVSVYGNYTAGLTRGVIVPTGQSYLNQDQPLAPFKSEQYEAGVKVDWGTITTTAAIYELKRPSAQSDGATPPTYGYFGEQRNRGLELSAYGELQRGLRGMASVAFVDAKLTNTTPASNNDNKAAGVPDTTASASLDWDTPWLAGLALNGRVIYTSGSYLNATNTQKFDSWTRYDIGARYRTAVNGKPVVLRANIENLFDKNYWLTTGTYVTVGSPRTLILSASIDF